MFFNRRNFIKGTAIGLFMISTTLTKSQKANANTAQMKDSNRPGNNCVLIVVDMQNGFLPGGSLAVPGGESIIPVINKLGEFFPNIVVTQDWHPAGHISFASSHPGKKPFDIIETVYGPQVLWPDHCVQGTHDADLHSKLDLKSAQLIIRKGYNRNIDSYSAFEEADHHSQTGLAGYLKERDIDTVYVAGLATDFCVGWTALDAKKHGFNVGVIEDASKGIDLNGSLAKMWDLLRENDVARVSSTQFI